MGLKISLFFYSIGVWVYHLGIKFFSLFDDKAKKWVEGRKDLFRIIKSKNLPSGFSSCWFHCASLGEFEQCRPLIQRYKQNYPDIKIVITFFSPSGYEVRKNYSHADLVCYLPAESKVNAENFIRFINPVLAIFIKYEFWVQYINTLHEKKIPVILMASVFRKKQIFFKNYGILFKDLLNKYARIFVQDEESFSLLQQSGIKNVSISGDTRFDTVSINKINNSEILSPLINFKKGKFLFIAGSIWKKDAEVIIPLINRFDKEMKIILAPHEPSEKLISYLEKSLKRKTKRYSMMTSDKLEDNDVLLIDSVGILSKLYRYADLAYIGGAFGKGLHNILEPLVYGLPVIFGPNFKNFPEAKKGIIEKTCFSINNSEEFGHIFDKLYKDVDLRSQIAEKNIQYVESNRGGVKKIMEYISSTQKSP